MQYIEKNDDSVRSRHATTSVHRQSRLSSVAGFTLVELVVVIAIVGVLLSIAAPQLAAYLEQGRKAKCLSNRYNIEQDERSYYLHNNAPSLAIDSRYQCASGGSYVWLVSDPASPDYPRVGCSLHYGQASAPLTSLGSTFTEITTGMIDLITKYYQQNNKYPADLSDLGLKPAEWAQPVNGLSYSYSPTTGSIVVEPASGFLLTVNNLTGTKVTINPNTKKDLQYVLLDGTWHYFSNYSDKGVVDISTLQVVQN